MTNLDRFAQGAPDPQDQPLEPIDECANDECEKPIYPGQIVWKHGADWYCSGKCLAAGLGASEVAAE